MSPKELKRLVDRVQQLGDEDRGQEARALLDEALERHPDEVEVVLLAGIAQIPVAPDEAAVLARRAVALAPESPSVLLRAASVLLSLGHLDEARRHCAMAMKIVPDHFPAVYDLSFLAGRIAVLDGNVEAAEQLLTPPFEEQPEVDGHGRELARLLESQNRWPEALNVAEATLKHHPTDSELEDIALICRLNIHGPDVLPPGATIEYE